MWGTVGQPEMKLPPPALILIIPAVTSYKYYGSMGDPI